MLQSQVNYWTLQENKRHNLQQEELGFGTLYETKRHNVQTENLGFETLSENRRHNLSTETLGFSNLAETQRHNIATEQLGHANLGLGYAQLGESKRHNKADEWLSQQNTNIRANTLEWQKDVDTTKLAQQWQTINQNQARLEADIIMDQWKIDYDKARLAVDAYDQIRQTMLGGGGFMSLW